MDKKTLIMIRTSDIAFNNTELTFMRKFLHDKYPSVMSRVINQTRQLMRAIQSMAKPNAKLTYSANRSHPEDTARYVVMEMLYDVTEQEQKALVSIEPVEVKGTENRDPKAAAKNIRRVLTELSDLSLSPKDTRLVSCGLIHHRKVLHEVFEYLDSIKQEIIVHEYSFVLDLAEGPHLYLDLRHKQGRSHHIRVRFDFFEQPVTSVPDNQPEPVAQEEGSEHE
jgi:hypothetical protein